MVWSSLRIFICPWISGVCQSVFPIQICQQRPPIWTDLSLCIQIGLNLGKDNRLYLSVKAVAVRVFEWQAHVASRFRPVLNYNTLQNARQICHSKTIVNMFDVMFYNAALWRNAVFLPRLAECCAAVALSGWSDFFTESAEQRQTKQATGRHDGVNSGICGQTSRLQLPEPQRDRLPGISH